MGKLRKLNLSFFAGLSENTISIPQAFKSGKLSYEADEISRRDPNNMLESPIEVCRSTESSCKRYLAHSH